MKKVLIVEDDEQLREFLSEQLALRGYLLSIAADGAEALVQTMSEEFDVILCDVEMPVMNGLEFLRIFRKQDSKTKFYLMSGGHRVTSEEALELGANAFFPKPFASLDFLFKTFSAA